MENYCSYSDEFKINNVYYTAEESNNASVFGRKDNYYFVLVVLEGHSYVNKNNTSIELFKNQMILLEPNTNFFRKMERGIPNEYISFEIQPVFFNMYVKDDKYFNRPFIMPFNKDDLVIDLNLPQNSYILNTILKIKKVISLKLSKDHLIPRFFTLISELCILCDKKQENKIISTDSVPTIIINYINHHYLENITYELLTNIFFVSKGTILSIINKYTENLNGSLNAKMTLKEYIYYLRFNDANKLLSKGINATKVATLCGFSTYTTFYRAYKKHFGISPIKAKVYTGNQKKWPMTR